METEKYTKLMNIVSEISGVPIENITESSHMVNELDFSSMRRAMLAAELEDLTGKRVSPSKIKKWETVSDMIEFLGDSLD